MDLKCSTGPANNVAGFMSDPENVLVVSEILTETLEFLRKGQGQYGPDGSFHAKESTLGMPIANPRPGHRMIRQNLLVTAIYAQGLSYFFDEILDRGYVTELHNTPVIFEEAHINRSLVLMNQHYKNDIRDLTVDYPMTLSWITKVALADTTRNRQRIRDKVAPILVAHGLWSVEDVDGERTNFRAGPLLVMFVDVVLGQFYPFDGEVA